MSSINYDLTKIKGIAFDVDGVLSPSVIPLHPNGEPMRCANIKDGYAIQLAAKLGYELAIITGGDTESVQKRFVGLGVQNVIMSASQKIDHFNAWLERTGLKPEQVVYVGDDIPDIEVMKVAGLSIAPADAAHEVKAIAKYISPYNGGYGVGREIIEQIMKAKGEWLTDELAFGW